MESLAQRDNRWKNIPLGTSKTTTIGSHGCTITCIAMLAGLTPDQVNERLLNVGGYAFTNLVNWTKINEAIPWLKFEWRGYGYNNTRVKEAVSRNGGCLVECDFDNNAATIKDKHWILFIGNRKMNDPWSGLTEPTGKYNNYTGYAVINKIGEKPDGGDMSDLMQIEKSVFEELVTKSGKYDSFVRAGYTSSEKVGEEIDNLNRDLINCRNEKTAQVNDYENKISDILAKIGVSNIDDVENHIAELKKLTEEYEMVKSVMKNGFGLTDKAFESEKAVFDAIEALTRGGNTQDLDTSELFSIIWGRFTRSLDKSKE